MNQYDGKLVPDIFTEDGKRFSEKNYERYCDSILTNFPGCTLTKKAEDYPYDTIKKMLDTIFRNGHNAP